MISLRTVWKKVTLHQRMKYLIRLQKIRSSVLQPHQAVRSVFHSRVEQNRPTRDPYHSPLNSSIKSIINMKCSNCYTILCRVLLQQEKSAEKDPEWIQAETASPEFKKPVAGKRYTWEEGSVNMFSTATKPPTVVEDDAVKKINIGSILLRLIQFSESLRVRWLESDEVFRFGHLSTV